MSVHSYRTIQKKSEGIYKEKGSKFIAFAFPVDSEAAIKENLINIKKEYFDARHHCFAWMLGAEKKHYRANDDGEPNHSAGDPILGQIRSKDITNVLVIVVRYFGGVKLGVSGLINAYRIAAEDALNNSIIIEKEITQQYSLIYDYTSTPEVMRIVKELDVNIIEQNFTERCMLSFDVRIKHIEQLQQRIELLTVTGHQLLLTQTST